MNCHQNQKKMQFGAFSVPVAWYELNHALNQKLYLALVDIPFPDSEPDVSNALSPEEQAEAESFHDLQERRHFLARRSFQNWFAMSLGGPHAVLQRSKEGAPFCPTLPGWSFSFSSSPQLAVGAACEHLEIGLDVEVERPVENALQLAQRFFSTAETEAIEKCPPADQSRMFLHLWSAKEACLKLIGKGMVHGPERVELEIRDSEIQIKSLPADMGATERWQMICPKLRENVVVTIACRSR